MKSMTRGIVFLLVACATSVIYGGQPPRGVAGVDVFVKQNPSKRAMTDARGNFAFDGLAPGTYALTFRARKAKDTKTQTSDKVTVAASYSIKVDGGKRVVNQSGLTSDNLLGGLNIIVEVGSGAKVRGQVAAGELKKMVWIPKEPGSHIPGHWAEADSVEGKRAFKSNAYGASGEGMRRWMERGGDQPQTPGVFVDRGQDGN
jgi:hypothetical protein